MTITDRMKKWLSIKENRLLVYVLVSVPALVWSFILHGHGGHAAAKGEMTQPLDPAWIAVLLCGLRIIHTAFHRFFTTWKIRTGLLISIAIIAAISVGEVFAAGEVALLMTIGTILEGRTMRKAEEGIQKLVSMAPRTACLVVEGQEQVVPAETLQIDDVIRIRPGETVPADCVMVDGHSSVDQAIITGESLPVDKQAGDEVLAGTINLYGTMDMSVQRETGDSTLQRMIQLIKVAQERRAPVVRLADKWAAVLVPTALVTAIGVGLVTQDVIRAVTVLVVFCPCALGLATPTAIMAAIANLSRHGVLVKSGEALESMGRLKTMAFDKTGTLTIGKPTVTHVVPAGNDFSEKELLMLAAAAERRSEHPLGKAIAKAAPEAPQPSHFEMFPGQGVVATVETYGMALGTPEWLKSRGATMTEGQAEELQALRTLGHAVVAIEIDGRYAGFITLDDQLREDARDTIAAVRAAGMRNILLLTGDHTAAAHRMAAAAGIDKVESELMPADKVIHVMRYASSGMGIAMVGDGVNDAAALKTATVGIAMGGVGSDIAIEAADVVLMRDDIHLLPYLTRMARRALNNITVNISVSLLLNCAAIALAALGLLRPALGAMVHNAGSVFVVSNAAMLLRGKARS